MSHNEWPLSELRTMLKFILNTNTAQAHQDFVGPSTSLNQNYDRMLNQAALKEWREAQMGADRRYFLRSMDVTWMSGEVTFVLPKPIDSANIDIIYNVTDGSNGEPIVVRSRPDAGIFWRDFETLQWDNTGPNQDTTLRFWYLHEPDLLVGESDIPTWCPRQHRDIIAYSAAHTMQSFKFSNPDGGLDGELAERRRQLKKLLSKGRPMRNGPGSGVDYSVNTSVDTGVGGGFGVT